MNEQHLTTAKVAGSVLGVALLLVAVAVLTSAKVAIIAFGFFALAGAGARTFTPLRRAFVVRRRAVDVGVLLVLGAALLYLGFTTPLA